MLNYHKKCITQYINSELHAMWANPSIGTSISDIIEWSEKYTNRLGIPCKIDIQNKHEFNEYSKCIIFKIFDGKTNTILMFNE